MATIAKREQELMDHLEAVIRRYALTKESQNLDVCRKPELKIIEILGKGGSLIMTDVAERALLSVSTVTSIMDSLVEKNLVRRERSEQDRRVVWVELTREGRKVYQELLEFHLRIVRGMLNALNRDEQDTLIGLFRKIVDRIEKEKIATA